MVNVFFDRGDLPVAVKLYEEALTTYREIGNRGEITRTLQETYFAAVRGEVERYKDWLEYVR